MLRVFQGITWVFPGGQPTSQFPGHKKANILYFILMCTLWHFKIGLDLDPLVTYRHVLWYAVVILVGARILILFQSNDTDPVLTVQIANIILVTDVAWCITLIAREEKIGIPEVCAAAVFSMLFVRNIQKTGVDLWRVLAVSSGGNIGLVAGFFGLHKLIFPT